MGVADKWKWVAININDHTLPKLEGLLDKLSQAVDPIATMSLIKQTESAISVIRGTSAAFVVFLVTMVVITLIFLDIFIKDRNQSFHSNYMRFQYGDTVETVARTYSNLMKLHSDCVRRDGLGIDARRTNVLLIGASETAEAYLRYDREFASDEILQSVLSQGRPFVFRTITDALRALDLHCTSEKKPPKTLFVLLLISTRDPSRERHEHEPFQIPSSLQDHSYAIVGIGIRGDGAPAHKLSKNSKGPNGERLSKSLARGPTRGVCFE